MANKYLGQTLINLGPQIPGMVRSNRQTEEKRRLKEIREKLLAEQLLSSELSRTLTEREAARGKSANEAIADALGMMRGREETVEGPPFEGEFPTKKVPGIPAQEALIESGAAGYMDQPAPREFAETFIPSKGGQVPRGWKQRAEDWNAISALPDGDDKNKAIEEYLYKWAPSVGYGASPESIGQAVRKATSVGSAMIPIKAETTRRTAEAGVTGGTKGLRRIPDKTREAITTDVNNIKNLQRVAGKFDPKYVGPIKGRVGDMTEWIGTIGADEKRFRAEVQNYVDYLIKSITGAQMSEKEAQRIMRETVNFNVNPEAYFETLESNIETIKMRLGSAVEGLKATRHETVDMEEMIKGLDKGYGAEKPSEEKFQTGKIYRDSQGRKARYLGSGQWEEL